MSPRDSCFLTFDDAVARMINFDYIPDGFSLLEMTDAFREDAELAYHNGQLDPLSADELDKLRDRLDACDARHTLAMALLERLEKESKNPDSELDFDQLSDGEPRVSLTSLSTWAANNFGIGFTFDDTSQTPQPAWEEVTIKVYANYRLGWRVGEQQLLRSSFLAIGLLDKRARGPNVQGGILIGLATGKKFPTEKIQDKHKAAISRLRAALRHLTGISADPFQKYNPADGWRPRFKLIDDRRNADERAKAQAQHVPYDDTRDYQAEDDEAGEWLDQNE